jgi:glycosyltransferase involved in cell wall biosynthesis
MPRETIFIGYDVVDKDYFSRRTAEIRNSRLRRGYGGQAASEIRNELGLPENYFLASARFIEKKNLSRLISAYSKYRQNARNSGAAPWDLVLLGDGPLRDTLNSHLSTLNLNDYVHLLGFKPYDELPAYYALAKAFVHASTTEQWGLVINEATASSLPVIVSDRCGCVPELVNGNGFTFDPTNEAELTARLLKMASLSDEERKQLGDNSYRIAANFTPECFGEGLERAASMTKRVPQKKFGLMDRALLHVTASYSR